MSYRLGVDVGGTFTDLMLFDESSKTIALEKVPTTVSDQAIGIIEGIRKITAASGIEPGDITMFLHGHKAHLVLFVCGFSHSLGLLISSPRTGKGSYASDYCSTYYWI